MKLSNEQKKQYDECTRVSILMLEGMYAKSVELSKILAKTAGAKKADSGWTDE